MEVRIGVQNVAREVVIESNQSPDDVQGLLQEALTSGKPLTLIDERGHSVTVPAAVIGYVDVGSEQKGRVGFGS
ncbi:DUF3107 domain-containing protein [Luteipulveratus sp. YIM 133132]|uniref:DUF3107 domain-containing protein n=1 Tax=Luteipulveratus flavus TaxID=3031728 RepID=A0ABT6C7W0_9MICO|nr:MULTISPECIES: DUF3107 domain-containing protein [unclassified Luteipulveratus]MDE9365833.1 DUF3107 domain-containing protein [Luteipulveratus sp. YIM 133132]MDF8265023.1 DUF3107 domain-containing protein [Luteipulveratus sp. YIM 133296]